MYNALPLACICLNPEPQLLTLPVLCMQFLQHTKVVGLGGTALPAALIHAPLSLLPVAFPASRFQQVRGEICVPLAV
jgi:hypothetical protein